MISLLKFWSIVLILFLAPPCFLNAQTYSLKGRVLDADTRKEITGAFISLRNTEFKDLSNAAGHFKMERILGEKYTLTVSAEGYNFYEKIIRLEKDIDLGNLYLVKYGSEGTGAALQKSIRTTNVSRLLVERPNMMSNTIYGITPNPKEVEGNFYLDEQWNAASILLYRESTVLEGFRVRYNINSNMFELMEMEKNLISVMSGLRIQNIVWLDSAHKVPRYFVNGMDFKEGGAPISGFLEVIVEGQLPLMRRTIAVFKESNYNTALMVGNRNDKIIKRNVYYYLKGKDLFEVPKKRKNLYLIFGDKAEDIQTFVTANEIDLKKPGAIFQVFTYYNSLFPGFVPIMNQLLDENN